MRYRTSPIGALTTHLKGGFYHDGRFATLADVVNHYDTTFSLNLTQQQKGDLVEYLKSLPENTQEADRIAANNQSVRAPPLTFAAKLLLLPTVQRTSQYESP